MPGWLFIKLCRILTESSSDEESYESLPDDFEPASIPLDNLKVIYKSASEGLING